MNLKPIIVVWLMICKCYIGNIIYSFSKRFRTWEYMSEPEVKKITVKEIKGFHIICEEGMEEERYRPVESEFNYPLVPGFLVQDYPKDSSVSDMERYLDVILSHFSKRASILYVLYIKNDDFINIVLVFPEILYVYTVLQWNKEIFTFDENALKMEMKDGKWLMKMNVLDYECVFDLLKEFCDFKTATYQEYPHPELDLIGRIVSDQSLSIIEENETAVGKMLSELEPF